MLMESLYNAFIFKNLRDTISNVVTGSPWYKVAKELLKLLFLETCIPYLWEAKCWRINKLLS